MTRLLLLLPLSFLAFGAVAEEARTALERSILKEVSAGKIQRVEISDRNTEDADEGALSYLNSFEPPNVCGDFDLTPADIREFFRKAQAVDEKSERGRVILRNGESRCKLTGSMVLQDGRQVGWSIDRARNGTLWYSSDKTGSSYEHRINVYCDTCKNKKYYPCASKNSPAFRPVLKNFTIEVNPVDLEADTQTEENRDRCKDFVLTKTDVSEFFRVGHPISRTNYFNTFDYVPCRVRGHMVLQDGRKGSWDIDAGRRGYVRIEGEKEELFYYCNDCTSKKFSEPCDVQCINEFLSQ